MSGRALSSVTLVLLAGLFMCFFYAKPAAALPNGFEDGLVADVPAPTALAFTPDGRTLVTSKPGQLWVYKDGKLLETPALNIGARVCNNSERGLLGVAVDPDFGTTGHNHVYLYYTYNKYGVCETNTARSPVNRVSRFTMSGDGVDPASEEVLIDNILSPNGNHNAGDVKFGKDGYLYVSVGDGGCDYANPNNCQYNNDASRDRHVLLGKVLRITRDGGIPPGNPYTGSSSDRCNVTGRTVLGNNCQETFALGFRNPFRMAFDSDAPGTSFLINDVGGQRWEEIDRAQAGADYGWNLCEGRHDNPYRAGSVDCSSSAYTPPVHEYSHDSGCESITGGAFVPDGAWPAGYDDAYLFGDYVCGKIFMLSGNDGTEFATNLGGGGPIAMTFGPYRGGKALYYTTFAGGGQVRRIAYSADYPTASIGPSRTYGPEKTITFDGSASRDPQEGPLTYVWDFGDGTTQTTVDPEDTVSHTYAGTGKYTVSLTVRDAQGLEGTAKVTVFPGDTPPEPVIESPVGGTTFRVGQSFTATGSVTDAEDGADGDPGTAPTLQWEVLRHHDGNHFHPWASGVGNRLAFTAPPPEGLTSTNAARNYLEIRLTATDSLGLSKTVTRRLEPKTVEVRFRTRPDRLKLRINGLAFRAPRAFVSWEGYALNVSAPRQRHDGRTWVFRSWSDGRAKYHTITTPANPTTYTAAFKRLRR